MSHVSQQGDPPDDHSRARAPGKQWRQFISSGVRAECRAGVLLMDSPAVVQIIGAPIACAEGVKDSWREMAEYVSGKFEVQYGDSVEVVYFDLFDPACPALPPNAQLPIVLINNEILINGGKISMPSIRQRLQELGVEARPRSST
jgi:hypothetical protein